MTDVRLGVKREILRSGIASAAATKTDKHTPQWRLIISQLTDKATAIRTAKLRGRGNKFLERILNSFCQNCCSVCLTEHCFVFLFLSK